MLAICFGGLGVVVTLVVAGITRTGHTVDMALMHFLLFYGGVFALIGLTAAVAVGLLASDRIVMTPSGRIVAQAVHRAVSFAAIGFLLIHIVTELVAGRARAPDVVVPFLGHPRTFYLGLGTLASDLFLLILVTGVLRARFADLRPTWAWRAVHSAAYLAWVLGILHGLLDGRSAKPYVDWSYGVCVAAVAFALILRLVVAERVRETASNPVPAAPPWLTPGGASPWMPGGWVTQLDHAPVTQLGHAQSTQLGHAQAYPRGVDRRPPLALPAPPQRADTSPHTAPPQRAAPPQPPRVAPPPPLVGPPPRAVPPSPPRAAPPQRMVPPHAAPPPRTAPPMTAMPGYPGQFGGDREYPAPDGPVDYYYGPDDQEYGPEWDEAGDLDAENYDPGPIAGEYGSEWGDNEHDGPGPGRPYPHPDTPHFGWAQ
jgi:hypothetical protein